MTSTQTVTIVGPNLPRVLSDRGTFHVHAAGCMDLKRGTIRHYAGEGWDVDVESIREVVEAVYCDHMAEDDVDHYFIYREDFHFAPCITLPEVTQ